MRVEGVGVPEMGQSGHDLRVIQYGHQRHATENVAELERPGFGAEEPFGDERESMENVARA